MHLKYHNLFMFCWQQRSAGVKLMVNVLDFFYIRCYSVVFLLNLSEDMCNWLPKQLHVSLFSIFKLKADDCYSFLASV